MTGEIEAQKAARRADIRSARAASPMGEAEAELLQGHLARFLGAIGPKRICGYLAYGYEPTITPLLINLINDGVEVLLPRRLSDNDLEWVTWDGSPKRLEARQHLLEPIGPGAISAITSADVVILPALCVDQLGNRLGQGGGSYDRALARTRVGIPKIAIIDSTEFVEKIEVDAHDHPVTHVGMPTAVIAIKER